MSVNTPPLEPIIPAYHLRILTDDQLEDFRAGTLEILEEVGIHCPSDRALEIYAENGGVVDRESQIVKLPSKVVLGAMSNAPRFYTMAARLPEFDLKLDGTAMYCATDGSGVETIDFVTGERRGSVKDDVAKMARVSDYLSSIGFYWPIVSAQDYPATAPLQELEASFNNTVKHIQSETVMDEVMAHYAVEMARAIAGGEKELRKRPLLSLLVCTIAPLAQDEEGMEAALVFAEAGLPVGFMSMANTASTAPATVAGTIVVADAEIVAAMVLIQMAFPGAPVYHSLMPGVMHPWSGAYLGTTWEADLFYPVGTELAHMWGVPTLAGIFGSDTDRLGWQHAADVPACLMLNALCGAETASGMGLLEGCTVLQPEAIVLDTDIYHRVRIDLAGVDTSREAMALDVIKAVGPRGHFLRQEHTRQAVRKLRFSQLISQPSREGGYKDPLVLAREKFDWILENHHPEPLEEGLQSELKRILNAAEQELNE
jgi:trimethylamine--corrinoid protein Co-methyltransferase